MKAAIVDRYGAPEVLRYDNVDKPAINPTNCWSKFTLAVSTDRLED